MATSTLRITRPSADAFVMHPLLAEIYHDTWWSPSFVEEGDTFSLEVARPPGAISPEQMDLVSFAMHQWMLRYNVDVCVTRRALVDVERKTLWCVDFTCGIQGACWLVCMFVRDDCSLSSADDVFMHRLRTIARGPYRSAVGLAAVCIGNNGRVKTSWIPP